MGWNPLVGEPPTSLYLALEELAKQKGKPHKLVMAPGLKFKRWPFLHRGDGLVHSLLGLYATRYWVFDDDYVPVEAITECGVLALLRSQQNGDHPVYDSGMSAPGYVPTCLLCVSGTAIMGETYRRAQKAGAYARTYGMSADRMSSNQPNMQSLAPRKKP